MAERTQEQKDRYRRKRFVKRILKRVPLYAMEEIRRRYPDYDEYMLRDDTKTRDPVTKSHRHKKKKADDDFRSRQLAKYAELLKQSDEGSKDYHKACTQIALLTQNHNEKRQIHIVVKKNGDVRGFNFNWQTREVYIKKFIQLANEKTSTWEDLMKSQDNIIDTMLGRNPK